MTDNKIVEKPISCTIAISCGSDSEACMISGNVQGVPIKAFPHPSAKFNAKQFGYMLVDFRSLLDGYSRAYNTFRITPEDPLSFDFTTAVHAWFELASAGRNLYRIFFDLKQGKSSNDQLETLRQFLKKQDGIRIMIDGGGGNLPWGLMYDDLLPDQPDKKFLAEVTQHFWGLRYQLELLPKYPTDNILWQSVLDNAEETRLAVTINKEVGEDYGPRHIKFFEELVKKFRFPAVLDPPSVKLFAAKQELLDNILVRREPQHLLYFFCHHKKGHKETPEGWYNYAETEMVVKGCGEGSERDETLSIAELERLEMIPRFEKAQPVIFMNACESSQTEVGDPSSFMLFFINTLSAGAFIGTEALIPTAFAEVFGQNFINEFLSGRPIGQILFDARRLYAAKYNNFFGLFYSLYGKGDIRLSRHVERTNLIR